MLGEAFCCLPMNATCLLAVECLVDFLAGMPGFGPAALLCQRSNNRPCGRRRRNNSQLLVCTESKPVVFAIVRFAASGHTAYRMIVSGLALHASAQPFLDQRGCLSYNTIWEQEFENEVVKRMAVELETLSAAYVRGYAERTGALMIPESLKSKPLEELTEEELALLIACGKKVELKMYRFKPHEDLPRVHKVLGFLRSVWPESLLDVGSGRGVFLFPFLCAFPFTPVTAADLLDYRVDFLNDIRRGGVDWLKAEQMDICSDTLPEKSFDVVTMLEVLEHIPDVQKAVSSAVRLAKRYVVVTVPSKLDNNPEHIHLLTKSRLTELFGNAGCTKLHFDAVPGHLFMVATMK